MTDNVIETNDGMKIRKLAELRTNTAKEYEDVMLSRVEEFKNKNAGSSSFNNTVQNTIVQAFSSLLDIKLQVDKVIGVDNLKKVHKVIDNLLLVGL